MEKASSSGWSSVLSGGADTIVARATPGGRGALAVIRVSGPEALRVSEILCPELEKRSGWHAQLVTIYDGGGKPLDQGIALPFFSPRSYTGEDMVEITTHGSPYLVEKIIKVFEQNGVRRAKPGEFTRRAVANGKMDVLQAEAIRDLIEADTAWQLRLSREQIHGALSERVSELRSALKSLLVLLEAGLDFEAQGVVLPDDEISAQRTDCLSLVNKLIATSSAGERIREGWRVVLLGPPNAGKSTLFNYLCGSEKAIVSPQPGTTRDLLEAELDIGEFRVVIQDAAGLREDGDEIEAEGHRRALRAGASAAVVVLLWAADTEMPTLPPISVESIPILRVRSKTDLIPEGLSDKTWIPVSCVTGEGVKKLTQELENIFNNDIADLGGEVAISKRHRSALEEARNHLNLCDPRQPEIAAEAVRQALRTVSEMIGEIQTEELLDEVFSTFCLGK